MQQEETLKFFKKYANKWNAMAESTEKTKVNVIGQRNNYVSMVADELDNLESFLDIGCGTGDLVGEIAKRNVNSNGVDFSEEMIEIAKSKFSSVVNNLTSFYCSSIFEFPMKRNNYDLISANGFIEYISFNQLNDLIDSVHKSLSSKGSFIVGSRNRLFNLTSMNSFTLQEIEAGDIEALTKEAIKWSNSKKISDMSDFNGFPKYQESSLKHENTGIKVSTRLFSLSVF